MYGLLLAEEFPKSGVAMDHVCLNHLIVTTGRTFPLADRDLSGTYTQGIADRIHSGMGTSTLALAPEQLGSSQRGVLLERRSKSLTRERVRGRRGPGQDEIHN